ncbi:hypothetical protein [Planctomicrobium piriforme]|uniref:Uncharacterized protein n=1 Tax=Planctomicrobium piriforme TaxID=1576369 RepID=A0A1I3TCA3_9PLAN|nr:hypothetical protein [Planctomicrobium piriforme]SFJ67117.1 hypothetical protein SAMN05421753_12824 [Planctomicrobium piriforme]
MNLQSPILAIYISVTCLLTPAVSAEKSVAYFGPAQQFKGFPREEKVGDSGHLIRTFFFTGRWLCIPIHAGKIAVPPNIPFTAPGIFVSDDHVVAVAAFDITTGQSLCLNIASEYQPLWMSEFSFQVLSQDTICLATRKRSIPGQPDDCDVLTVSLTDRKISTQTQIAATVKKQLEAWAISPLAASGNGEIETILMRELQTPGTSFLGCESVLGISLLDLRRTRYLAAGTRGDRIVEFDRLGESRFQLCEREVMPNQRRIWELSEAAFERERGRPNNVFFPCHSIAPTNTFVIGLNWTNGICGLVAITDGKLIQVWNVPEQYKLYKFETSEDESHVGVVLWEKGEGPLRERNMSINVKTGETAVTSSFEDVTLVGVTNAGELIEASGSDFYLEGRNVERRLIARPIEKSQ